MKEKTKEKIRWIVVCLAMMSILFLCIGTYALYRELNQKPKPRFFGCPERTLTRMEMQNGEILVCGKEGVSSSFKDFYKARIIFWEGSNPGPVITPSTEEIIYALEYAWKESRGQIAIDFIVIQPQHEGEMP